MRCIRLNISKAFSLNLKKNGFSLKGKYIHNPMATPWEKITQRQHLWGKNRTLCQKVILSSIRQKKQLYFALTGRVSNVLFWKTGLFLYFFEDYLVVISLF